MLGTKRHHDKQKFRCTECWERKLKQDNQHLVAMGCFGVASRVAAPGGAASKSIATAVLEY